MKQATFSEQTWTTGECKKCTRVGVQVNKAGVCKKCFVVKR